LLAPDPLVLPVLPTGEAIHSGLSMPARHKARRRAMRTVIVVIITGF
jgi:hypothetical protein